MSSEQDFRISKLLTESTVPNHEDREQLKRDIKQYEKNFKRNFIRSFSVAVSLLFLLIYGITYYILWKLFNSELAMIEAGKLSPSDRVIDTKVVLALIAASFAQIGAGFYLILKKINQNGIHGGISTAGEMEHCILWILGRGNFQKLLTLDR